MVQQILKVMLVFEQQCATANGLEKQLMEIHTDGLSALDAIEAIFMTAQDQCATIGTVHVHPQCVLLSHIGDRHQIINRTMVGSACGTHNGKGNKPFSFGLFNRSFKLSHIHRAIR
ncbi:Uncharacterised protein [Vibrio cholerae]|nr:Uncharacterised protein [Vibrio cholerae]CSC63916.1 Uncharacterised protein [Vibrio cholerae]